MSNLTACGKNLPADGLDLSNLTLDALLCRTVNNIKNIFQLTVKLRHLIDG